MAVVFVTRLENGETKNEGLCLKCAKELEIPQVNDILEKWAYRMRILKIWKTR